MGWDAMRRSSAREIELPRRAAPPPRCFPAPRRSGFRSYVAAGIAVASSLFLSSFFFFFEKTLFLFRVERISPGAINPFRTLYRKCGG